MLTFSVSVQFVPNRTLVSKTSSFVPKIMFRVSCGVARAIYKYINVIEKMVFVL